MSLARDLRPCPQGQGNGTKPELNPVFVLMKMSQAIIEFLEWWKADGHSSSLRGYDTALKQFCVFVRNKDIEDITDRDVTEWLNLMKDVGYDTNSLLVKAPVLRTFFGHFLKKIKVLNPLLIPMPKQDIKRRRVPVEEDCQRVIEQIRKDKSLAGIRDLALFTLLKDTGARIGEVLSLKVQDVDLYRQSAVTKTEKSRGRRPFREILWTEQTNKYLVKWISSSILPPDGPLFISLSGLGIGKPMSYSAARDAISKYCREVGVERIKPHDFRHLFGQTIAAKGANDYSIANLMGHSSIQSSMRYTMINDKRLRKVYRKYVGK